MCGICGIWEFGASEGRIDLSLVERMRDEMRHRGPDDEGASLFDDGRLGLGFRRLAIIDLSEERGLDFVNEIEGDFAIALWDAERTQLVLARDRVGVKPLYYYQKDGRLIFASEIKAILKHPQVTAEIDEESLYHYLTFLTTPAPQTLFRDIHKLPAGHLLIVKRDGTNELRQYWDALPGKVAHDRSEEEHEAEILRQLRDSIGKRMMSDVPF